MKIGYKIKDLRARQRITLKQLARKTGLTTSFLSQLERELASPSISSLEKIAEAMGTRVGYFFEDEDRKELIFVKRCVDEDKNTVGEEKKVFCETLASGLLNIKMQPQIFTMAVGAELVKELNFDTREKFGIVLGGKVELLCNLERITLKEGDSVYCAHSQQPQKVTNIGTAKAKILWISFRSF